MQNNYTKRVNAQNCKVYDFLASDGNKLQGVNLTYAYQLENGVGFCKIKLPYELKDKLKDLKFPCVVDIIFELEDLSKTPNCIDVNIVQSK